MIRIGITGGIGSGKSTVCQLFRELGVAVYDCDARARELMSDGALRSRVVELLGTDDRVEIARKVFNDKELLASLNAIVHPAVERELEEWFLDRKSEKYVIVESAILFESGFNSLVDSVLVVTAPLELRLTRSHFEREDFLRRVTNQMTDEERVERADYAIDNSLTVSELKVKVKELDKLFRE